MSKMITLTDDGHFLSSDPINPIDYINITLNTQMQLFQSTLKHIEDDAERQKIKEDIYNTYNESASAFLSAFAPEIELRPDLTTQAILEKENEILDRTAHKNKYKAIKGGK